MLQMTGEKQTTNVVENRFEQYVLLPTLFTLDNNFWLWCISVFLIAVMHYNLVY